MAPLPSEKPSFAAKAWYLRVVVVVQDRLARLHNWRPYKSPHWGLTEKGKLEGHWRRRK